MSAGEGVAVGVGAGVATTGVTARDAASLTRSGDGVAVGAALESGVGDDAAGEGDGAPTTSGMDAGAPAGAGAIDGVSMAAGADVSAAPGAGDGGAMTTILGRRGGSSDSGVSSQAASDRATTAPIRTSAAVRPNPSTILGIAKPNDAAIFNAFSVFHSPAAAAKGGDSF